MNERSRSFHLLRVPAATLQAMNHVLTEERSGEDAAFLLRQVGMESGGAFHELFRGWLADADGGSPEPEDLPAEAFWEKFGEFFSQLGWGTLEHEQLHTGIVALSSSDWAEAPWDAIEPCCHFSTGMFAEMLRRVAGADLAGMEVECRGAGANRCRFLIGAPAALEAVFQEIQRGTAYEEAIATLS